MEREPNYRWLADIMCYDKGNRVLDPVAEWIAPPGGEGLIGEEVEYRGNGTLYDHLLAVVHCEHWYEIARCPQNPYHEDENNILGGWINDPVTGEPVGINTSIVAPRFWIYSCSGVPLFDFEIKDAIKRKIISDRDYEQLKIDLAAKRTPSQELVGKLAKGGYFDVGDWRQEALNEIEVLKGLSFTKDYYSGISGSDPNFGACCMYAPPGATSGFNAYCFQTSGLTCGLCGGDFFANRECRSDLCVSCSGFKPHQVNRGFDKYLGPVRKRLWIPEKYAADGTLASPGGIGIIGVSGPARLDPKKARPNQVTRPPTFTRAEPIIDSNNDRTLIDLQLPEDLIKEPWTIDGRNGTRVYPREPLPGESGEEPQYEEWRQFKIWRDSQWLYMHARPGGWDYVCSGYYLPPEEGGNPFGQEYTIPDLPRQYSTIPGWPGGCLAGLWGVPRKSFEYNGGCSNDIECGYIDDDGNFIEFPLVGCGDYGLCLGIDCFDRTDCPYHPEQGGGATPCEGVAFAASCDGMRFVKYKHKFVSSSPATPDCHEGPYLTCAGETINSYLYTVNKETGNFGDFCPHSCRSLSVPKAISNLVPRIFSNRASHKAVCDGIRRGIDPSLPDCPAYPGKQCKGLYCFGDNIVIFDPDTNEPISPPYWYAPLFTTENYCCTKRSALPAQEDPPSDPIHNAAACRRLPGPGYPGLYDGKFVGEALNFNPTVCCFYCPPSDSQIDSQYLGVKPYYECYNELDRLAKENNHPNSQAISGVGFFYKPEDVGSFSSCETFFASYPECPCSNPGVERTSNCPEIPRGDDDDIIIP